MHKMLRKKIQIFLIKSNELVQSIEGPLEYPYASTTHSSMSNEFGDYPSEASNVVPPNLDAFTRKIGIDNFFEKAVFDNTEYTFKIFDIA